MRLLSPGHPSDAVRHRRLRRELDPARAVALLDELKSLPIERVPHRDLIALDWEHYQNVSAYDALYVALARQRRFTLLTADEPLLSAPNLGIELQPIRLS